MPENLRVLHYINQFFGGLGGEDEANLPPSIKEAPVGPGRLLEATLQSEAGASVVATVICGDNYIVEESENALASIGSAIAKYKPDLVIAGPAFDAGRYGLGCAIVCMEATKRGVAAITGMHPENTGILTHRQEIVAVPTTAEASGMQTAIRGMTKLGLRLVSKDQLGPAVQDGYIPRGFRRDVIHETTGANRAFTMMMARVKDEPYLSEVQVPGYESVSPAPPIGDVTQAKIALVTSGGLVPKGNPDKQVGGRATDFFRYSIDGLDRLSTDHWESVHMGFSTAHLNTGDPSYVLPLPIVRTMEKEGAISGVHPDFFSTTGNGTPVTTAIEMGSQIGKELAEAHVDGVLLVAT